MEFQQTGKELMEQLQGFNGRVEAELKTLRDEYSCLLYTSFSSIDESSEAGLGLMCGSRERRYILVTEKRLETGAF